MTPQQLVAKLYVCQHLKIKIIVCERSLLQPCPGAKMLLLLNENILKEKL
jgi:hypothetical protein